MKNYIVPLCTCLLFSCAQPPCGPSDTAKKNLQTEQAVNNMFVSKDFSKIGDYIDANAVDHSGDQGDVKGLDSIKAQFEKWSSLSDDKMEIVKQLADDEYVMTWMRSSGTMKKDGMHLKTGDQYNMESVDITKYKDGKAVEHWSMVNPSDMAKIMATTHTAPMDSTKVKK